MIVFELECQPGGHRFEGWFASTEDFTAQQQRGLVACPTCGIGEVRKAPMAPRVARKGNQLATGRSEAKLPVPASPNVPQPVAGGRLPPDAVQMLRAMAAMQAAALESSRWVGNDFAEESRAMHYGEREVETIHGEATIEQAKELLEEGIPVAPLPFLVAPPGKVN